MLMTKYDAEGRSFGKRCAGIVGGIGVKDHLPKFVRSGRWLRRLCCWENRGVEGFGEKARFKGSSSAIGYSLKIQCNATRLDIFDNAQKNIRVPRASHMTHAEIVSNLVSNLLSTLRMIGTSKFITDIDSRETQERVIPRGKVTAKHHGV